MCNYTLHVKLNTIYVKLHILCEITHRCEQIPLTWKILHRLIWAMHVVPLQQTSALHRVDPLSRAALCATSAEDVDRNQFLQLTHVVLPLWACLAVGHNPGHQLFLGQASHSPQDGLNTLRLWLTKKAARLCEHVGIPPVGHCPVEEARKSRVVQIVIGWWFDKEVDVALSQRPSRGSLCEFRISTTVHCSGEWCTWPTPPKYSESKFNLWLMIYDFWSMMYDLWRMIYNVWSMTYDLWLKEYINWVRLF